jgi:signal transduction histidine kinase
MTFNLKLRLAIFVLAIATAISFLVWAAHSAWQRVDVLRERLTTVQLESFHIADHFQQTLQQLNNLLLRYSIAPKAEDWRQFERRRIELDNWIDEQRPHLSTAEEKSKLDEINTAYDDYVAAAKRVAAKVQAGPGATLKDFSDFEQQSERLLNLGFELATAHRESLTAFLRQSHVSLVQLRTLLLITLVCLLLLLIGLAVMTYRGMIAPLQMKLIESQSLIERNEKLASLGMLAAGVAHEIRNPLTAIKARLFTLQKRLAHDTANYTDSEVIAQEINRLERIVREVLEFARPSDPQFTVFPTSQMLSEVEALMKPQLDKMGIRLVIESSPSGSVQADPQQIKQVLINLVQNSAESIVENGTITLRVRHENKRLAGGRADVVIIEVADTGKGMSPEVQKRLFDPFFSTKETGTGLGLAIASRIIEKHAGALQYQTEVNRGTTFGIVLPRA